MGECEQPGQLGNQMKGLGCFCTALRLGQSSCFQQAWSEEASPRLGHVLPP